MQDHTSDAPAQQTIQPPNSLANGAIIANVLVTIIIITGMIVDKNSVTISVLSGVGFFAAFGGLVILTLSGALTNIVVNGQNQRTIRQANLLQYNTQMEHLQNAQRLRVISQVQPSLRPPAEGLPETLNFVPAIPPVADNTQNDAENFVAQLFDPASGRPLWSRMTRSKQQIQFRSPSKLAVDYLLSLGVVTRGQGLQLYFNLNDYPTLYDALNCVRTGVKMPSSEGGENVYSVGEGSRRSSPVSNRHRFRILRRDKFQCQLCGFKASHDNANQLHVDHKIPRSQGGTNDDDNLWTLCDRCNLGKSDQIVDELFESGAEVQP